MNWSRRRRFTSLSKDLYVRVMGRRRYPVTSSRFLTTYKSMGARNNFFPQGRGPAWIDNNHIFFGAYDVIIFEFREGGNCPRLPPFRAPMVWLYALPWAPAEIFPGGGQNYRHFKKLTRFRRVVQKSTIFRRASGANENFCVFVTF